MNKIYGIANCQTVKKARAWLEANGVEAEFVDFKKQPPSAELLQQWLRVVPASVLVNRKGTTWRKLSAEEQSRTETDDGAVDVMLAHPSVIKRPVLVTPEHTEVGFSEARYAEIFGR